MVLKRDGQRDLRFFQGKPDLANARTRLGPRIARSQLKELEDLMLLRRQLGVRGNAVDDAEKTVKKTTDGIKDAAKSIGDIGATAE